MTLRIEAADSEGVIGKIAFGTGSLPPPTDPNVGYPANVSATSVTDINVPFEGFEYTMLDPAADGDHLTFAFDALELWGSWCSLQTSFPQSDGTFKCLPEAKVNVQGNSCSLDEAGMMIPIDCAKLALCGFLPVCHCDEHGCGPVVPSRSSSFDLTVKGDSMNGNAEMMGSFDITLARSK